MLDRSTDFVPIRVEIENGVAVIVIDNPPVNASMARVRAGLVEAIRHAGREARVKSLMLIGAGKTFVSGSDIREVDGPLAEPQLPAVIAEIEACSKPAIAALHGNALGGGFELALGCDARIAAADANVGLPEVTLGIIPAPAGPSACRALPGCCLRPSWWRPAGPSKPGTLLRSV